MRPIPFATHEVTAEFVFQFLYGAGKGGLGDITFLRRLGEIQSTADG
jgi:hypothetical protein